MEAGTRKRGMKPERRHQGRNEGRVGKNGHVLRIIFKLIILAQIDDTLGRESSLEQSTMNPVPSPIVHVGEDGRVSN